MDFALERVRLLFGELRGLPPAGRLVLMGALVVILALLLLLLINASAGSAYEPIYTNLSPGVAAQIAQALAAQKIPYQVSPDGTTVSVPENDAGQARLDVAGAGVSTSNTVGFSIFDKPLYGNSDFQNQVMFTQALEGELDQTIMAMSPVAEARVSVVLPQQGLYTSQNTPASAAVFLQLKPFSSLSPSQVAGIQALVAHSVQGLSPQNVTVVDSQGDILSSAPTSTLSGPLAMQENFDNTLSQQLVSLLTPVLGPGNVVARVNATLNFNQETVVKDLFTAPLKKGNLVTSLEELKSSMTGGATPPTGVTGNIPTYGTTGNGTSQSLQITQKNAVDETQQTLRIAPGAVSRLTVSVVVNRHLTPKEQAALTQVVAAAIGYDPARHDQIIVQGLPFNTSLATSMAQAAAAEAAAANRQNLILMAGVGAGILVFLFLVLAILRALRRRPTEVPTPTLASVPLTPGPEMSAEDKTLEELSRLVRQNPEAAAEVVRGWLREE